jgi:hypothetical protein
MCSRGWRELRRPLPDGGHHCRPAWVAAFREQLSANFRVPIQELSFSTRFVTHTARNFLEARFIEKSGRSHKEATSCLREGSAPSLDDAEVGRRSRNRTLLPPPCVQRCSANELSAYVALA